MPVGTGIWVDWWIKWILDVKFVAVFVVLTNILEKIHCL
jgi:hypothetical protein